MPLLQKASLVTPQSTGLRGNSFIRLSSHYELTLFTLAVLSPAPLPPPPQCSRNVCSGFLHIDTAPFLEAAADGAESQLFGLERKAWGKRKSWICLGQRDENVSVNSLTYWPPSQIKRPTLTKKCLNCMFEDWEEALQRNYRSAICSSLRGSLGSQLSW